MADNNLFHNKLLKGLRALAETAFPKKCRNCGRIFKTAEQFLSETQDISASRSGLKEAEYDDGTKIVEAFRNCPCGSTLMDFFSDRRDLSEAGIQRRKRFEELLGFLDDKGIDRNTARMELLKIMRGEKSEILAKFVRRPRQSKGLKTIGGTH